MIKKTAKIFLLVLLLNLACLCHCQLTPGVDPISARVMPKPKNYTYGTEDYLITDPCAISYQPRTDNATTVPNHIWEIIGFYSTRFFKNTPNCASDQNSLEENILTKCPVNAHSFRPDLTGFTERILFNQIEANNMIVFDIHVQNATLEVADSVQDESYKLKITNRTHWEIKADKYVGLLRALETFSQLLVQDQKTCTWSLKSAPLKIEDQPDYPHRGFMIDTARHFLSMETILNTIDTMLYNKLNVLHWHITDTESFPFPLHSFPNITKYGTFSQKRRYSFEDIQQVIQEALFKGIQVIPEVDSPGHSLSWSKSKEFQSIGISCQPYPYQGQLDPTLNLTYTVARGIMEDMNSQFTTAKYVHFGGDEVNQTCWDQRPEIKTWMNERNMDNYTQLEDYYRKEQKKIWRTINATKPAIYWTNSAEYFEEDDIIQWWGTTSSLNLIANYTNKIILSNYDQTYLDVGSGTRYGTPYGTFESWGTMRNFTPNVTGIKGTIIGGESCLWSEMNNDHTQFQRIWTRNSVFAETLWNQNAQATDISFPTRSLVSRMVFMQHRLNARGIPASPVTVQICEDDLSQCFSS